MYPEFSDALSQTTENVNRHLERVLSYEATSGEIGRPRKLVDAMRHGVLNGGKRIRPFLLIQTAALFEVAEEVALPFASALECLHSYSLIHDDLPAMDNDDLRRGKPTVHQAFDEATAILAGDALLTLAFDLITAAATQVDGNTKAELVGLLAKAAGLGGMVGGQVLDIAAENQSPTADEIRTLQSMKTGALIRFACEAGAVLGRADAAQRQSLRQFGETIGLAFQLADDLLDVTSDQATMGKAVNKDSDQGKGTLVSVYGVERVQSMLKEAIAEAESHLVGFGERSDLLRQTAHFIASRTS